MAKNLIFILGNKTKRLLVRLAFLTTRVKSMAQTWEQIANGNQSVVRFGDGEVRWMSGDPLNSFENNSKGLQESLVRAINTNDSRLFVCVNEKLLMRRLGKAPEYIKSYYKQYVAQRWGIIIRSFPKQKIYGDACISHYFRETKGLNKSEYVRHFETVKSTWRGKRVLVVEGEGCRFGMGNDLLDGASSIIRVLCPNRNSFEIISEIKNAIVSVSPRFDICLLVLGPTATVLASELFSELPNKRFLDIGTLDTDYMCFLHDSKCTCSIEHKTIWGATKEGQATIQFEFDETSYQKQIVCLLGHTARDAAKNMQESK